MADITYLSSLTPFVIERYTNPKVDCSGGYGRKLPTDYRVHIKGDITRKVWCVCFSNAGSTYVVYKGRSVYIPDYQFPDIGFRFARVKQHTPYEDTRCHLQVTQYRDFPGE